MPELSISSPPWWRVVAAFLLAPLMAAFVFACVHPLSAGLPSLPDRIFRTTIFYASLGGYPVALVLGIPTFFFLRQRVEASAFNCAIAGAAVASVPWLLLGLLSNPNSAYSNGHVTHENGAKTLWGWIELLLFVGEIAALGAAAGVFFWAIAAAGVNEKQMSASAEGDVPID